MSIAAAPSRQRGLLFVLLGLSCLTFAALFAYVAAEVRAGDTRAIDLAVRHWMLEHRTPLGLTVFRVVTRLGEQPFLIVVALVVAWSLFRRGAGLRSLVCGMPFLCPFVVDQLKAWYQVMRPPTGVIESTDPTSFPSAHTADCTAAALVLGYAMVRDRLSPRVGIAFATLLPLSVAVSRLYLDRHWASDVTAGWMVGVAFASAVCILNELMRIRAEHQGRSKDAN